MSSAVWKTGMTWGAYPERAMPKLSWLDEFGEQAVGSLSRRLATRRGARTPIVHGVAELETAIRATPDAALRASAKDLGRDLRRTGLDPAVVTRCFATIRELAHRTLGLRHHDVQVRAGWVMLSGMVAEMDTGEGKTLTASLVAATAALAGLPVHVISVNDYLVRRDADELRPLYEALGLRVGVVEHGMEPPERRAAYTSDITYVSNKELTFDYLRDRIALGRVQGCARLRLEKLAHGKSRVDDLVLRGLCFGIVDEADSVLVDEARTPLIISGGGQGSGDVESQVYEQAIELARELDPEQDFISSDKDRQVFLTEAGDEHLESLCEGLPAIWRGPSRRRDFVGQALVALHMFERDTHYLVDEGQVQIVDEFTGRLMPDRTWQRGLHQMIEVKEGCEISSPTAPLAKIGYQRFFRRYQRLAGMTGTAAEVKKELWSVYRMPVVRIPTHRPSQRRDLGMRVHARAQSRWEGVVKRVTELHEGGRPVLIGTRSVGASELLSEHLEAAGLVHRVLNARQDAEEADIVSGAGERGRITVATNMAGRGTDIKLGVGVADLGGLHVIATEAHESERIDRQLFGRCARQGDPGSYEMIVSLEDELSNAYGVPGADRVSGQEDSESAQLSRRRRVLVWQAQRRAEWTHARIRSRLLKTDERTENLLAFSGQGE